jgi:hypothetical protein
MNQWTYGLSMYAPFFVAGIAGGRNDWLRSVENMATWLVWSLRTIVVGFWVLYFFLVAQSSIPISSVHIDGSLQQISIPVYAIAITLAEMQLFYQYFNSSPQSKFMKSAGLAAYTVYVIHPWVLDTFVVAWIEILKAANHTIAFDPSSIGGNPIVQTLKPDGEPGWVFNPALIWPSWLFIFVLTQVVVWPLAHYFRKLPVLNKML